jgi:hypothetical protein
MGGSASGRSCPRSQPWGSGRPGRRCFLLRSALPRRPAISVGPDDFLVPGERCNSGDYQLIDQCREVTSLVGQTAEEQQSGVECGAARFLAHEGVREGIFFSFHSLFCE